MERAIVDTHIGLNLCCLQANHDRSAAQLNTACTHTEMSMQTAHMRGATCSPPAGSRARHVINDNFALLDHRAIHR